MLGHTSANLAFASLRDVAYGAIRAAVLRGEISPDAPLREADLVRRLRISRTPIREALRRLEAEGLLAAIPHRGYRLVTWDPHELDHVYAVRIALERLSARSAAEARNRIHLAQLATELDDLRLATRRGEEDLAPLNASFHMSIAAASGNAYLQTALRSIFEIFHRYPIAERRLASRRAGALAEHGDLLRAIEARRGTEAERLMQEHLERGHRSVSDAGAPRRRTRGGA